MIVVIGHNNPDIDSIASSIGLSYLLNQKGKKAESFIGKGNVSKEVIKLLKYLNIELPQRWNNKLIHNPTVIVDFNTKEQAAGDFQKVVKIVDHHPETASTFKVTDKNIAKIGSTSTLIAIDCLSDLDEIDNQIMILLLAGIISDTKGFASSETTEIDKQIANILATKTSVNKIELQDLIEEWSCFEWSENLIDDYMKEGIKIINIKDKQFVSSVIFTKNSKDFFKNDDFIINHLKELEEDSIRMLIVVDIEEKKTILFHNATIRLENPYIIDGISSRKREIKDLVMKSI